MEEALTSHHYLHQRYMTVFMRMMTRRSVYRVATYIRYNNNNNNNNSCFTAICLGLPGWAGTRRNIHPPTYPDHHPIFISFFHLPRSIASSLFKLRAWQSFLHNLSPCPLWSTSWSGALHLIFHAFLHPISVFFTQHMPIPSQPVLL